MWCVATCGSMWCVATCASTLVKGLVTHRSMSVVWCKMCLDVVWCNMCPDTCKRSCNTQMQTQTHAPIHTHVCLDTCKSCCSKVQHTATYALTRVTGHVTYRRMSLVGVRRISHVPHKNDFCNTCNRSCKTQMKESFDESVISP